MPVRSDCPREAAALYDEAEARDAVPLPSFLLALFADREDRAAAAGFDEEPRDGDLLAGGVTACWL